MAVLVRKPAKPITYPPTTPRPRSSYRYATGGVWTRGIKENWGTIATHHSIPNVWDLIFYNFQCRNPKEVNWCMKEFLHCTKSNDGKNYSFSPTDTNPVVYIPPEGHQSFSPDDLAARTVVQSVLRRPELEHINFSIGGAIVDRSLFKDVLGHVDTHTILCAGTDTGLPEGVLGQWTGLENLMIIRRPTERSFNKDATIVHECVHAGLDVRKRPMLTLEGESCGYVAEAIFSIVARRLPLTFDPFDAALRLNAIRQWAAQLGKEALLHRVGGNASPYLIEPTNNALRQLRAAISADPKHRPELEKPHADDGV